MDSLVYKHLPETLYIKLSPGSKQNQYVGMLPDGTIKIRIKEKAVDNKANIALINFLKELTGENWKIVSGHTNPRKILKRL